MNWAGAFFGSEIASNSTSLTGGRIGAIFGGAEIDLRRARPAPDAELDVFAAFGVVEIAVPEDRRVEISGFPLFGGFEDATAKQPLPDGAPRLRIDATVLFGGIEVRHLRPSRCVGKPRTICLVIDPDHRDEEPFGEWDLSEEDFEPLAPPPWRRPLLIAVAALTAIAMAVVPLYNVFSGRSMADNGLEICGFDYCVVQEAMRETGVDLIMSNLVNTFLDDDAARVLADDAADYLDIRPVDLRVVDDLEGRLGGVYDPANRSIFIERPARAWTVLHEVAHAVETGHEKAYQDTLADLARWADDRTGS